MAVPVSVAVNVPVGENVGVAVCVAVEVGVGVDVEVCVAVGGAGGWVGVAVCVGLVAACGGSMTAGLGWLDGAVPRSSTCIGPEPMGRGEAGSITGLIGRASGRTSEGGDWDGGRLPPIMTT